MQMLKESLEMMFNHDFDNQTASEILNYANSINLPYDYDTMLIKYGGKWYAYEDMMMILSQHDSIHNNVDIKHHCLRFSVKTSNTTKENINVWYNIATKTWVITVIQITYSENNQTINRRDILSDIEKIKKYMVNATKILEENKWE